MLNILSLGKLQQKVPFFPNKILPRFSPPQTPTLHSPKNALPVEHRIRFGSVTPTKFWRSAVPKPREGSLEFSCKNYEKKTCFSVIDIYIYIYIERKEREREREVLNKDTWHFGNIWNICCYCIQFLNLYHISTILLHLSFGIYTFGIDWTPNFL